jgi:hypothetical protein
MSKNLFAFGVVRPEFAVPVLNERAVRAAAGLLFALAMVSFMNAWLLGNFAPTRVFVVAFLLDFTLRLFVNPSLAPSMVLGQWLVRRQQPEWTGALQKRFAWTIGWLLALTMLYLVVLKGVIGPVNLIVCGTCLLLLGFESAFGICIGCWIYNRIRPEQAQVCPGGVCEFEPDPSLRIGAGQWATLAVLALLMGLVAPRLAGLTPVQAVQSPVSSSPPRDSAEVERCKVPDLAKAMGHEEKWKLHNGYQ